MEKRREGEYYTRRTRYWVPITVLKDILHTVPINVSINAQIIRQVERGREVGGKERE